MSNLLQISSKSWHYRLHCFVNDPISLLERNRPKPRYPRSLCTYFWRTIGCMIAFPFVIIGLLLFGFVYAVVIGLRWGIRSIINLFPEREKPIVEEYTEPKEPNLFIEYVKARKKKACPLIVVDGTLTDKHGHKYSLDEAYWIEKGENSENTASTP